MQFRGRSQLTDWLAVGRNGDPAWWPKVTIVAAMHQSNRGSLFSAAAPICRNLTTASPAPSIGRISLQQPNGIEQEPVLWPSRWG